MDRHEFDKFRGVGGNPMVTSVLLHLLGSDNNLYAFLETRWQLLNICVTNELGEI